MLYLAEVKKQKTGPFGSKTEIKLLACQRNDQSWNVLPGEEILPGEEANGFGDGVLIVVNLGNNRQIQGNIESAAGQIVRELQNFSKQLEKWKSGEEEIEQWKQSLTYQSQELNRREMEMEARAEELQAVEEEVEQIEQQRQELELKREEAARLKEEFERSRQELEGAWEHLRGEQRRFEEHKGEFQQSTGLSEEQTAQIEELIGRLSGAVVPTESLREQLGIALEVVNYQQSQLDNDWQELEQRQQEAQQKQAEVEYRGQEIQNRKQELQEIQKSLGQAKAELKVQQNTLEIKQEAVHMLSLQLRTQEELHQELARLATTSADVKISQQVNIESLEKMPLGELEGIVQNLQQELEKVKRFVNDQEEELTFQRQTVEELQGKIKSAGEYDRIHLETELAEEEDRYQMLDETLVGQRRNLREREEILNQHLRVCRRRQGVVEPDGSDNQKIDLGPVLSQLETQRQQQEAQLRKVESQVEQMRNSINQAELLIEQQAREYEAKETEIKGIEDNWQSMKVSLAEVWARVNLAQETLQPRQEALSQLTTNLNAIASIINQVQEIGDYQLQSILELRQTLNSAINSP
ncbi:MAG TPA: hypothetical protein DEA78_25970 [Cyanobacteria bacterium UBA11159]|nr:hypothetical protein [Cyanobacteria bacterium UBA11366]HBR77028.1 hypothetical protein [Cyanobacteria bacterium UBA11159]